ncbi:hypothetical protein SAMN04488029_0543 [Reichenbachiella faecimaris]|uniref:Uncharacterized protein n=1 Tax=Reichenbachiella faecimaris TaxID=692418 RepID=A0A1W2G6G9_REIFA|nr:hypothetical protein [Reichenbachiella faecimaris]SMD32201.1 hypothetical protein SAMN04488029_0543 [Reichenbachiella faecimaris]
MKNLLLSIFTFVVISHSQVQEKNKKRFQFINSVLSELLDQITIETGETMDSVAIRNLFHPSAQLAMVSNNPSNLESVSLNEFLVLLKDPYYVRARLYRKGISPSVGSIQWYSTGISEFLWEGC